MVRLRELSALTIAVMGAMTALIVVASHGDLQIPGGTRFHFAERARPIRLASNEPLAGLRVAEEDDDTPAVQIPPAPEAAMVNPGEALDRLRVKVPGDLVSYFDVFLYVSKAAEGSLAQHMYIFRRSAGGDLQFEQSFPVSTGRERHEKYFTSTPVGLFELDPNRFERYHYSRTWHAAMPWAMFLNASFHGRQTGIALHSSGQAHAANLGHRASGGCVRLPPAKAAELFERFRTEERGYVPEFAYDSAADRTSAYGHLVRDAAGQPVMYYGYRVLLVIENYRGGPVLVALA
jgi:hypothetical protein